jgi:GcrA cell cycle regulator
MTTASTWTSERVDELRRLIGIECLNAEQASVALGVTKNTVIGKCWREGIAIPPDPRKLPPLQVKEIRDSSETNVALARRLGVSAACVSLVRNWHTYPPMPNPFTPMPNPFPDLSGCLWGHGDPAKPGFRFCGEPRAPGKPYCPAHAARAYDRRPAVEVA